MLSNHVDRARLLRPLLFVARAAGRPPRAGGAGPTAGRGVIRPTLAIVVVGAAIGVRVVVRPVTREEVQFL